MNSNFEFRQARLRFAAGRVAAPTLAQCIAELDILVITGDAYVDHPAFGPSQPAEALGDP